MKTIVVVLSLVAAVTARPEEGYANQGGPGGGGPGGQTSPVIPANFGHQGRGPGGGGDQGGQGGQAASGRAFYDNQGGFGGGGGGGGQGGGFPSGPALYNFQWDVNDPPSGNFYGHGEERDGDNTQGSYYVQLPDSRRIQVDYFVDQSGYHPTITFEGEAQHPSGGGDGGGGGGGGDDGGYYQ